MFLLKDLIIDALKTDLQSLQAKCSKMEKSNNKLLWHLTKHRNEMSLLEEKLSSIKSNNPSIPLVEDLEDTNDALDIMKYFTKEDIKMLNKIEILKNGDRKFLSELLQILYRGNLSALCN